MKIKVETIELKSFTKGIIFITNAEKFHLNINSYKLIINNLVFLSHYLHLDIVFLIQFY